MVPRHRLWSSLHVVPVSVGGALTSCGFGIDFRVSCTASPRHCPVPRCPVHTIPSLHAAPLHSCSSQSGIFSLSWKGLWICSFLHGWEHDQVFMDSCLCLRLLHQLPGLFLYLFFFWEDWPSPSSAQGLLPDGIWGLFWCQGSDPGQLHARQVTYSQYLCPLCCFSSIVGTWTQVSPCKAGALPLSTSQPQSLCYWNCSSALVSLLGLTPPFHCCSGWFGPFGVLGNIKDKEQASVSIYKDGVELKVFDYKIHRRIL